jgi:hypothetical protein
MRYAFIEGKLVLTAWTLFISRANFESEFMVNSRQCLMFYAYAKQHLKPIRFTYKCLKVISHGTD